MEKPKKPETRQKSEKNEIKRLICTVSVFLKITYEIISLVGTIRGIYFSAEEVFSNLHILFYSPAQTSVIYKSIFIVFVFFYVKITGMLETSSCVWKFFEKVNDDGSICQICMCTVKNKGGNTSNLATHLGRN